MSSPVARIIGTGSFVPSNIVTNEEIVEVIKIKSPEWIEEKLGIKTRRFLHQLDAVTGLAKPSDLHEIDMSERAARMAIEDAGLEPKDIDYILAVTCTPDYIHFSYPAIELHRRLGLPDTANAFSVDSGCGGAMQMIALAHELLENGVKRNILIVASNCTSALVNRDAYQESGAWLSPYLFGDGAGAMVISSKFNGDTSKILATTAGTNGTTVLVSYPAGGGVLPGHLAKPSDFVYKVDGKAVKELFAPFMQKTILSLIAKHPFDLSSVSRFFLHQANFHLLKGFSRELGLPEEKVAVNVDKYGNTSAAATLILYDEDRRAGLVKKGDLVLFAAIGAGAHFGGALVSV
jgi:3-oxoacyl-[acyl-carrier-protein] synthase-3